MALTAVVAIGVAFADAIGLGGGGPSASPGRNGTGVASSAGPTSFDPGDNPPIDGVSCDSLEQSGYHLHAHLTVRIEGAFRSIPANIGIHDTCLYWLHTHRDSGIMHVEAPAEQAFTLGDFFDVWGQSLSEEQVLDRRLDPNEHVYGFVNGQPFEGDPRTIVLTDLLSIEIQVGTAPLEPLPFEFPADFL